MREDKLDVPEKELQSLTLPDYCRQYLGVDSYWPIYKESGLSKNTAKSVWNGEDRDHVQETHRQIADVVRLEPRQVRILVRNTKDEAQ